jgi:hypothetical protein
MQVTREQINNRIEAYAIACKNRDSESVSKLFAENFDHIVHGIGTNSDNPWNTKKATNRDEIRKLYEVFFSNIAKYSVEYINRIIDTESNSASMVVLVKSETSNMENSLHLKWNKKGEIIYFYNWYGQPFE